MTKVQQIRNANDLLIAQGNLDAVEQFFTADYTAHTEDKDY